MDAGYVMSDNGSGTVLVHLIQHADKVRESGDPGITELGRRQAERAGEWARGAGLGRLYCSPLRRTRETAACVAAATGLEAVPDGRARERLNWDGPEGFEVFHAEWARTVLDRGYVPALRGDSSVAAAERLLELIVEVAREDTAAAIVTHGGVTADLLRTLLGDAGVDPGLLRDGVPSCAVTTLQVSGPRISLVRGPE
ncbi:histidine phosphatase family protein [Actinospica durhamensis]|uniref:Histidine phosphatase family protein n=1 Tax=Actinospica durhamensis TaxID=1508375 RepID=A0A941EXA2_9ACTN|nr:histidine phosphatase family protein [Actinospica durhamensis]MBR7838936.1 histidine phosphatase family protein [Actinospica durhamensis]